MLPILGKGIAQQPGYRIALQIGHDVFDLDDLRERGDVQISLEDIQTHGHVQVLGHGDDAPVGSNRKDFPGLGADEQGSIGGEAQAPGGFEPRGENLDRESLRQPDSVYGQDVLGPGDSGGPHHD